MLNKVLSARIRDYAPANAVEQDNVLQELMQHYVLSSLARAGLFARSTPIPRGLVACDQLHYIPCDGTHHDAVP